MNPCEAAYGAVATAPERAFALPRAAFADAAVFEAEVERVFKAGWVPVARESEVGAPGDYRALELFGVPVIVTRDMAGEIRLLSGVCRHRGRLVAEGSGNARALTCPYHLWRYRLDGRLAAAPGMERSAAFDRSACALPAFAVERWGGWVFANLDGKAAPLGPQLAPLAGRLAAIDPASLVTADVITLDSPWNWKLMVENFLESYHHIGPHAATLQQSNPGLGTYAGDGADAFAILENPPANDRHGPFVVAAIFPLTLMFFTEGPERLGAWYEMDQIAHGGFRLRIHLLTTAEFAASPEAVAAYRAQVMAVHDEDIPACRGAQAGVMSPLYEPGPLSHLEACLWRFHAHLQRRLAP